MTLRPAFLMCARNKVELIQESAERLLAQTYEPLKIIFSDHWSTDGTAELLYEIVSSYCGPHDVSVIRCPHVDRTGILGLNAHMEWAIRRIDADVIFFSSADDLQNPKRVERVMEVFAEHPDAEYVATRCSYWMPDGTQQHHTLGVPSGWVDLKTEVIRQVGFCTGGAYRRDLWLRCAPMRGIEAPDLIVPAMAALVGKMFYLDETLHESRHVADREGVSVERAMQAAANTDAFLPLIEVNQYQFCSSHFSLMRRFQEMKVQLDPETTTALVGKLMTAADRWVQWRDRLAMERVQPLQMAV